MGNDLTLKVGFDIAKFQAEMNKTTGVLNKWSSGVTNSLAGVAAGFSALAIGNFVLDVSKLAGEAEGVRAAFEKLPQSIKLMQDLKAATSGTVSELDLMKRSVMAANFGISLEALPKLLEFAAVRAKQTGQSVDYLVDSIVTGIGRKSKLILDNLGISAVALDQALGGASTAAASVGDVAEAVGKIAAAELENMGKMSENASTKMERLSANWVNLKVAIGEAANGTGILGAAMDKLNDIRSIAASDHIPLWKKYISRLIGGLGTAYLKQVDIIAKQQKINDDTKIHEQVIKEVDRAMASGNAEAYINAQKQHVYYAQIFAEYQSRLPKPIELTTEQLEKQAKALEEVNKKLKEQAERKANVDAARTRQDKKADPVNLAELAKGIEFTPDTKALDSMNAALDGLIDKNEKLTEAMNAQRDALIAQVATFSVAFGEMLVSGDNFAQGMAMVSAEVVNQIGKMIMAQMIQKAIMDKSTDFNFFAKLALIGVAIGAASGLLRKIGKSGGGGGGYSGGSSGSSSQGMRTENLGQRITLEFTGDAGKVLKQKISEQDRRDSRTKVG